MSSSYTPSNDDIVNVIRLLHDNGISVSNSKSAYEQLKQYETNPSFCVLLSTVFAATECPVPGLPVEWTQYRQLAGITLKNNLSAARHALGEAAVLQAARCAIAALSTAPNIRMARVSAQIVVKITELTSFEWWAQAGLGDIASFLLQDLLSTGGVGTLGALYPLQYIMEDLPKQVGAASEQIITRVSSISTDASAALSLRKAAFRMCFNSYEQASLLDWNIDTLSSLQQGLVNASWPFACTCTTLLERSNECDLAFLIEVLRSCWFLLDYFDYFPNGVPPPDQQRLQQAWIGFALQTIGDPSNRKERSELVAAAIDLIAGILDAFETSGGEGVSSFLAAPVVPMIPQLIEALVACSYLSEEEVEDIMTTDDYQHRNATAVIQSSEGCEKDIAEDRFLEDNMAAMTLRSSSIKCIGSLCNFECTASFSVLIKTIENMWKQPEWKVREVAFVLLGTMADSCFSQMESLLPMLVQETIQVVGNTSEHVCVTSMAIWSLSRVLESVFAINPSYFDNIVNAIGSRMESPSKRVQQSAVSGLLNAITVLEKYATPDSTALGQLGRFVPSMCNCLSVYHTGNLSLLVDLIVRLLRYLSGTQEFSVLSAGIKKERMVRASSFETSYTAMYVNMKPNALLDKDILSLDRAVIALLVLQPDSQFSAESLKTWTAVLEDILTREVTDDADLVFNTLLTCAGYVNCINTKDLQEWMGPISSSLSQAAFRLWETTPHKAVKAACVTLLGTVCHNVGVNGIPEPIFSQTHQKVATSIVDEEDPQFKKHLFVLGMNLVQQKPNDPISATTYTALNSVLRSDVFAESLLLFIEMAVALSKGFAQHPQALLAHSRIDVVVQLLLQGTNDLMKSEATINVCSVLPLLPPTTLSQMLPDLLRLVYSWQQVAYQYPGTLEALKNLLLLCGQQCGPLLQESLNNIPPSLLAMVRSTYQI